MSALACKPIGDDGRLVAPMLEQVDCQITAHVGDVYGSLFGPFGFLEPVLTGVLTLYVAFYGYQLIVGRGSLSLSGLAPKILLIGLVVAFATRWSAYQGVFLNLFYGGADQLGYLLLKGGATPAIGDVGVLDRLDRTLRNIIDIANHWHNDDVAGAQGNIPPPPTAADLSAANLSATGEPSPLPRSAGAVNLLWFSAIALALSTFGVLLIAKILLGLLLAAGPVLIITALFSATRGLFEGWLKTLALYGLLAAFATVLTGGVLFLIEPMTAQIAQTRAAGDASPQPVFLLAVTVFIFALLMLQLFKLCARMTASWRLPAGVSAQAETPSSPAAPANAASDAPQRRVGDIVVAVERGASALANDRRATTMVLHPAANDHTNAQSPRRTRQNYRGFGARLGAKGRLA